jgi:hypothetical protein
MGEQVSERTCAFCGFGHEHEIFARSNGEMKRYTSVWRCRRNAPSINGAVRGAHVDTTAAWPRVEPNDSCGEFTERQS